MQSTRPPSERPLQPLFPIWGIPTDVLSARMVQAGLRAHITCIDPKQLSPSFVARTYTAEFIADLTLADAR
jgi:diphthamide synthase (EF-2-diphthine--ammonia ligase)